MTVVEEKDEHVIRVSKGFKLEEIQKQLDYIRYKEIASKSKATQQDVDKLVAEVKKDIWEKYKPDYLPGNK